VLFCGVALSGTSGAQSKFQSKINKQINEKT